MPILLHIYLLFSIINAPLLWYIERRRTKVGKEDMQRISERHGRTSVSRPKGKLVWLHAASVGESLSLLSIINGLLSRSSEDRPTVLITTNTTTSAAILKKILPQEVIHQYFPYENKGAISRFLDHWEPNIAIWTEGELWPRILYQVNKSSIKMFLINARASQKTRGRWQKFPKTVSSILNMFVKISAQDQATADLLESIGVIKHKIFFIGSTKEDASPLPYDKDKIAALNLEIGDRDVWLAASTHEGEEELILRAHQSIVNKSLRSPLLILAPRHPERGRDILNLSHNLGFVGALRSNADPLHKNVNVYVADTIGEMGLWYRLSPISFIAGSLGRIGGHNPFEPMSLRSAIISGKNVSNFDEIYQKLSDANACRMISDSTELAESVLYYFNEKNRTASISRAQNLLKNLGGASSQIVDLIISEIKQ